MQGHIFLVQPRITLTQYKHLLFASSSSHSGSIWTAKQGTVSLHHVMVKVNIKFNIKISGINTIISRSKEIGDDLHTILASRVASEGESVSIHAHKSCYCSYTSRSRHSGVKKRKGSVSNNPGHRPLKSQIQQFEFKRHCLLCGDECLPKDPKHPERWKQVRQCRTVDRGKGNRTFREVLEDICNERQDAWSTAVSLRLAGVRGDLHASDAQYHISCYYNFRKIPQKVNCKPAIEESLRIVVEEMKGNVQETWTKSELYEIYSRNSGSLTLRQMFANLCDYFGDEIVVLNVVGCETVVGFRNYIAKTLKMVKQSNVDDDDEVDNLIRKIKSEVASIPKPKDYDLSDFSYRKIIKDTSTTLLCFVSKLVSGGAMTKASLSLTQSIQQHISGIHNQTTLGLAVKLHHKYGSREMIGMLNDHGFVTKYDDILHFRKSVAQFVLKNPADYHKNLGLTTELGPIFSWADNFDLYITSPNGIKSTHAMVSEFTQHPAPGTIIAGNTGVMQLKIPQLKWSVGRSLPLTH